MKPGIKTKKIIVAALTSLMVLSLIPTLSFADTGDVKIARSGGMLKWAYREGTGFASAPTPPTVVGEKLYIGFGKKVRVIDTKTGEVIRSSANLKGSMGYTTIPIKYVAKKNMLLVTISDGQVQALDANTLKSLWVTEKKLGQSSICPISVADGYFYTGTWYTDAKDGYYYCYSLEDEDAGSSSEVKKPTWQIKHAGGFYWAGACIVDDKVIFSSENGAGDPDANAKSKLYCCMSGDAYIKSGAATPILSETEVIGDGRSTAIYDSATDAAYFTTKAGYLYKASFDVAGGVIDLNPLNIGAETVGEMTLYNGRFYLGTTVNLGGSNNGASVLAIDPRRMRIEDKTNAHGRVQGGVFINTAKSSEGKIYIYATLNNAGGGIVQTEADISGGTVDLLGSTDWFTPIKSMKQYCVSPIAHDADTLYYKNDSCNIMAIATDILAQPQLTLTAGKKQIDLRWTASPGANKYIIYRAGAKNGKYKQVKTVNSTSWKNKKLKGGKTYYYKVKAVNDIQSSVISAIKSKKTKK